MATEIQRVDVDGRVAVLTVKVGRVAWQNETPLRDVVLDARREDTDVPLTRDELADLEKQEKAVDKAVGERFESDVDDILKGLG